MKLADCFGEMISFTLYFAQDPEKDNISCDELKEKYNSLISRSKDMAKSNSLDKLWEQGFFPVSALVDEMIMTSNWKNKREWTKNRLQVIYFNTSDAGEEFFERLDSLDDKSKELREIFVFCLALGFKGKYYRLSDHSRIENLINENIKKITDNTDLTIPEELFPEAYEPDSISKKRKKTKWRVISPYSLLFTIVPTLFLIGLYYFYNYKLDMILYKYFNIG